jgi:outer membrane protein assembly factor BamB
LIEQPIAARLRASAGFDVIGVNAYGMVYAISGENGTALWSARYRPGAKKGEPTNSDGSPPFTPLLLERKDKPIGVLVAFDGGLRALDGATGREMWRAALPGEPVAGVALSTENEGTVTISVFDNSHTLTFLKGDTGQVISQTKLEGSIVGRPVPINVKNELGVLLALNNGTLDVRNIAGVSILAIRVDSTITAAPLIVRGPRGNLLMLGTEVGLVALDATALTPLWRVATEADAPQGTFASADLDGDGNDEVVMITRRGRIVVINLSTGKIKWFTEGAADSAKAVFADLNGDGTRDVLVAGGSAFAVGYSGKDGALIWRADESSSGRPVENATSPRVLATAPFGSGGSPLIVGADPGRTGLRAVGLPVGALK